MPALPSPALALALLTACADKGPTAAEAWADCGLVAWAQGLERLPLGEVAWLPLPNEACPEGEWALIDRPDGARAELHWDDGGVARITPDRAGTWTFQLGLGPELELGVVEAAELPGRGQAWAPGQSIALAEGELWAAGLREPLLIGPAGRQIAVGAWPVALAWSQSQGRLIAAQRGNDSLSIVDLEGGYAEDTLWVGDQPAGLLLSPDGARAYVPLAGQGAVAEVDLRGRALLRSLPAPWDPRALVRDADGAHLWLASSRSGQGRVAVSRLDLARGEEDWAWEADGLQVAALALDEETDQLYALGLRATEAGAEGLLLRLDAATGELQEELVLPELRRPAALLVEGDGLYLLDEALGLLLELGAAELEERARWELGGQPRSLLRAEGSLWAHDAEGRLLHRIAGEGAISEALGEDPRSEEQAAGQAHFLQTCAACHPEGQPDGLTRALGEAEARPSRALQQLSGRALGWQGHFPSLSALCASGHAGWAPTSAEAAQLCAFLEGLEAPGPANPWTGRDGAPSEAASRGRRSFEEGCASCHLPSPPLPLRVEGPDGQRWAAPSLLDAHSQGRWRAEGGAAELGQAVEEMIDWQGLSLDSREREDLLAWVQEQTDRDLQLRALDWAPGLRLRFNRPLWPAEDNLRRLHLFDAAGAELPAELEVEGPLLWIGLDPAAPLPARLVLEAGLESADQLEVAEEIEVELLAPEAPRLVLEGAWRLELEGWSLPLQSLSAEGGAEWSVEVAPGLEHRALALISGVELQLQGLPLPAEGGLHDIAGELVDEDGDGRADSGAGTLTLRLAGREEEQQSWSLIPAL